MQESSSSTSELPPKQRKRKSSEQPQPISNGSNWKQNVPLQGQVRDLVLAVLEEAQKQLNTELQGGWYAARANPDGFKARRLGMEEYRLRVIALLTRPAA